jgi:hypothetical protein
MNKSFFLREFQDTKGVKRIRRSKDEQHNGKKGQKYKQWLHNIHIKLKIE